jgi:hypothetical protein
MSEPSQVTVQSKLKAALQTLQTLNIPFRGPFITPKQHRIYIVDGCILTEAEIVVLHECGKFSPENIGRLLSDLKSLQMTESHRSRRSQRVMLQLDVLVRLEMPEGERLQTHAFTVIVNAHGGLLESPFRMTVGQKITLVNPQSGEEVNCAVMGVHKSSEGYFTTAFEFEQDNPSFWAAAFPPLDWGRTQE